MLFTSPSGGWFAPAMALNFLDCQFQPSCLPPLQGVPFHGFAERLGAAVLPGTEAARKAERQAKLAACKARTGQRW